MDSSFPLNPCCDWFFLCVSVAINAHTISSRAPSTTRTTLHNALPKSYSVGSQALAHGKKYSITFSISCQQFFARSVEKKRAPSFHPRGCCQDRQQARTEIHEQRIPQRTSPGEAMTTTQHHGHCFPWSHMGFPYANRPLSRKMERGLFL